MSDRRGDVLALLNNVARFRHSRSEIVDLLNDAARFRAHISGHDHWDSTKHPRDRKGEFTHGGPGSGQLSLDLGLKKDLDASGNDSALKTVDSEVAAIKAEVKHHKIVDEQDLSIGAMGQVQRCTLDDGRELIHKKQTGDTEYGETSEDFKMNFGVTPKEANDAEELAPYVSEVFGAGAPAVWRAGKYEAWQDVAPGTMAADTEFGFGEWGDPNNPMNSEAGRRIALFDAVTNNGDRNPANWLITDDGRPVPIDHGKTFMYDMNGGGSPFVQAHEGETLSEAEAASMLAKFDALKPKFAAKHRLAWFEAARQRLVNITQNGIDPYDS
jgi:hypothetical protein